jgi:hypothetical protein
MSIYDWLLNADFAPLRKLWGFVQPYIDRYPVSDLKVRGAAYIELFFIVCDGIDANPSLDTAYKRRLKKLALIFISKNSRDGAYRPSTSFMMRRIRVSKYCGVFP